MEDTRITRQLKCGVPAGRPPGPGDPAPRVDPIQTVGPVELEREGELVAKFHSFGSGLARQHDLLYA
jgi:hypothetical protein